MCSKLLGTESLRRCLVLICFIPAFFGILGDVAWAQPSDLRVRMTIKEGQGLEQVAVVMDARVQIEENSVERTVYSFHLIDIRLAKTGGEALQRVQAPALFHAQVNWSSEKPSIQLVWPPEAPDAQNPALGYTACFHLGHALHSSPRIRSLIVGRDHTPEAVNLGILIKGVDLAGAGEVDQKMLAIVSPPDRVLLSRKGSRLSLSRSDVSPLHVTGWTQTHDAQTGGLIELHVIRVDLPFDLQEILPPEALPRPPLDLGEQVPPRVSFKYLGIQVLP